MGAPAAQPAAEPAAEPAAGAEAAAGESDSEGDGEGEESAAAAPAASPDDAAEVAALLREENLEALGDEDRDKLTQVGTRGGEDGAHWQSDGLAHSTQRTGKQQSLMALPERF